MRYTKKYYNLWLDFGDVQEKIDSLLKVDPINDNAILWNAQVDYLQKKDKQAELLLWTKFPLLCLKQIKKQCKTCGIYLNAYELEYKSLVASDYVLRRYKRYEQKGKVYIITNFIASAYWGCKYALYNKAENDFFLDSCLSLEDVKK